MLGSLFLSPKSSQDALDLARLGDTLASLDITAGAISGQPGLLTYRAGEGFVRHVVFAGCSPHLRFEPARAGDLHFCHVALHGPFEQARILTGENTVKPRCPLCRRRHNDWAEGLRQQALSCTGCGEVLPPTELDWRQHAAVGRCFVEMRNVFPGEASPSDQLMAALRDTAGFDWRYAWAALHRGGTHA